MKSWSQSRLNRYLNCPLSYKFYYLDGRPEPVGEAAIEGSEGHAVLAAYAVHCIDEKVMTDLDWIRSYPASPNVREVLDACADSLMFEPGTYYIEDRLELDLDGGYPFVAIIDLLKVESDRLVIRDYKSDRRIRSQAEVDSDLQGKVYACVAAAQYPGKAEYVFEMMFIRHGVSRQVVYTADDIPRLRDEIIGICDRIVADQEHRATPGPRCTSFNCAFTADCPAADPLAINNEEEAEAKVARLIAMEAGVKALKTYLQPYVSKNGVLETNGMALDFWPVESRKYPDILALRHALETRDHDPDKFLKADTTALKKLAKTDAELAAALEDISIDNPSTRFETRKVKS